MACAMARVGFSVEAPPSTTMANGKTVNATGRCVPQCTPPCPPLVLNLSAVQGTMFYDVAGTAFYRGGWKDDCRHGHGVAVYPSGNTYDGDWANDMKNGSGTMEWKTRKEVYTGGWKDDQPHGRGSHVWQEGRAVAGAAQKQMCNRYEGEMANGLRNGLGVFYYSNGAQYDGEWVDGKKHGNGVFTFEDGEIYEGEFISDRMVSAARWIRPPGRGWRCC